MSYKTLVQVAMHAAAAEREPRAAALLRQQAGIQPRPFSGREDRNLTWKEASQ